MGDTVKDVITVVKYCQKMIFTVQNVAINLKKQATKLNQFIALNVEVF